MNDEIRIMIEEAIKKTVQQSVQAVKVTAQEGLRNYFRETEVLLYNYPALRQKVESDEKFLYDPEGVAVPVGRSKDIIRFTGSGSGHGLDLDRYTEGVKSSMMRTRQEVLRIDRALDAIKNDKYFDIVPMKYFDRMTVECMAESYECDETTIRRNKNRLVNKLAIMLFGADALPS